MELEENGERTVRVSTIELFFDLVFVFTLTQLTGLLAAEPNWRGLLQAAVLLSVIWWIYDGYLWLTNAIELEDAGHRLLLLGGMGGFLVIALAIPTAYDGSGLDFGLGYLLVVVLHSGLYMRETSPREAAGSSRTTSWPRSSSSQAAASAATSSRCRLRRSPCCSGRCRSSSRWRGSGSRRSTSSNGTAWS